MPKARKPMTDAELFVLGEKMLAQDQSEHIADAAIVIGQPNPNPPLSLRLSSPLIEALDRLAAAQHRKRSNLIQHILWEYVHAHEAAAAEPKAIPAIPPPSNAPKKVAAGRKRQPRAIASKR